MCNLSERIEERARIEARAEGIMEKSLQVYKNCIARNMSEKDALAIAGLTKEQLAEEDITLDLSEVDCEVIIREDQDLYVEMPERYYKFFDESDALEGNVI